MYILHVCIVRLTIKEKSTHKVYIRAYFRVYVFSSKICILSTEILRQSLLNSLYSFVSKYSLHISGCTLIIYLRKM